MSENKSTMKYSINKYNFRNIQAYSDAAFGQGNGPIMLDDLHPKLFVTPGIVKAVLSTIILTRIIYNLKQIHQTKTMFFFLMKTNI